MIMLIGCVTIGALIWLLAFCLGRESDAEKRRAGMPIHRVTTNHVDPIKERTMEQVA